MMIKNTAFAWLFGFYLKAPSHFSISGLGLVLPHGWISKPSLRQRRAAPTSLFSRQVCFGANPEKGRILSLAFSGDLNDIILDRPKNRCI
jgi:hypothetical protein